MRNDLNDRLWDLKTNRFWFWTCLIIGICLIDPLPIDPIPFLGIPGTVVSLFMFWATYYFHKRRRRLQIAAVIALAQTEPPLTVIMVMNALSLTKDKAEKLINEMLDQNIIVQTNQRTKINICKMT